MSERRTIITALMKALGTTLTEIGIDDLLKIKIYQGMVEKFGSLLEREVNDNG